MKTITKLSLIAAALAALGTSAAFADDQQLQNRIALQRMQSQRTTTVAAYANHHGVGRSADMPKERGAVRYETRTNAKGQQFGLFVAAN